MQVLHMPSTICIGHHCHEYPCPCESKGLTGPSRHPACHDKQGMHSVIISYVQVSIRISEGKYTLKATNKDIRIHVQPTIKTHLSSSWMSLSRLNVYWNPEHPPASTPTRRKMLGVSAMSSFILCKDARWIILRLWIFNNSELIKRTTYHCDIIAATLVHLRAWTC